MLKYWVALLVVLNAAAMAWQWGALAPWGLGPQQHQEPERLKQQLRPETIQPVLAPSASGAASAQDPSPADSPAGAAASGSPVAPQSGPAPVLTSPPESSSPLPSLPANVPATVPR